MNTTIGFTATRRIEAMCAGEILLDCGVALAINGSNNNRATRANHWIYTTLAGKDL